MIFIKESFPPILVLWGKDNAFIANTVDTALHAFNLHATITSGMEGLHPGDNGDSKHYHGLALDFRTSDWPLPIRDRILMEIESHLGFRYKQLLESDHLHVERI